MFCFSVSSFLAHDFLSFILQSASFQCAISVISPRILTQITRSSDANDNAFRGLLQGRLQQGMKKGKAPTDFPWGKDNHFLRRMQIHDQINLQTTHASSLNKNIFSPTPQKSKRLLFSYRFHCKPYIICLYLQRYEQTFKTEIFHDLRHLEPGGA